MANINAAILGTGRAYPEGLLTNADLEQMVETSDEWITSRTGIKQRHKAAEGEYTSMFAGRARPGRRRARHPRHTHPLRRSLHRSTLRARRRHTHGANARIVRRRRALLQDARQ